MWAGAGCVHAGLQEALGKDAFWVCGPQGSGSEPAGRAWAHGQAVWAHVLPLLLPGWVTLGESLGLSEPQFPHL